MRIERSTRKSPPFPSVAMCCSGLRISSSGPAWMSAAVTSRSPLTSMRALASLALSWRRKRTSFKLSTTSVTSSTTPGIVENSWSVLSKRTEVIAAPRSDERRMRRRELPSVVPKPRSSGSISSFAYLGVSPFSSISTFCGRVRSRQFNSKPFTVSSPAFLESFPNPVASPWSLAAFGSLRVQLDDQRLVDRHRQVGPLRQRLHCSGEGFALHLEPFGHAAPLGELERIGDACHLPAVLPNFDLVTDPDEPRR